MGLCRLARLEGSSLKQDEVEEEKDRDGSAAQQCRMS